MTTKSLAANPASILIVDDSEENRLLLSSQLGMEGYQILLAEDGPQGLEVARAEQPDLILLDVMMPEINGFEVCRQLKDGEATQTIPIIMVTALREVQYRIKGIEAGADEFLSRPHHREELLVRVKALIQLKRTREGLEQERNRLQLLYEISRAISMQIDLEPMMANIIAQTRAAVGATNGSIVLLDENGRVTHRIRVHAGQSPQFTDRLSSEVMSHGLAGWLARHNRGVVIKNAEEDERWLNRPGDEGSTGAVIGVPLSRADRVVGVLFLMHPQLGYFTEEHLALLETIGAQITASIENAFLFNEISEERRKLSAILAQSTDAIITTDEAWNITLLNQAAEQLFELNGDDVVGKGLRRVQKLGALKPLFARADGHPAAQELNHDERVLYASVSPIQDVGYVAVLQDITELKRVEDLRLQQERRQREIVKETFSRYMGPRLVEHVLSNEPGLLARRERRTSVVLFADLRDSTRMIVNVEPNTAIPLLNEFFTSMTDIVYEFDGTVFDLTGDEVMVGFNVPLDQEDAPYRALLAAITMQRRFSKLQRKWQEEVGITLGLGIGIDQGSVVVGNVGAESRMTFRMVGEAVNIAHRLVDLAEDGQIFITESIYDAVEKDAPRLLEVIDFQQVGPVNLKGKSKSQTLYRASFRRRLEIRD
ncbi:MAG TPA: response regulator [Candidatus Sulfomarinibacteraceae bacterium]|nr:response regulator [Candidatus Sulfomarinibacteraceae bacterium]